MFSNITKALHCLALTLLQPRASTAHARALGCRPEMSSCSKRAMSSAAAW